MNTTTNTTTGKVQRLRAFLRYAWDDQVAAHHALLRRSPYDDFLINRRGH